VTPEYFVRRAVQRPLLDGQWNSVAWRAAETLEVAHFYPKSGGHHPVTHARMVYDEAGLYGIFRVEDCYVLCTHTEYQSAVYKDACVEFFVKPKPDRGYMNFEMNCGGAMLLRYIEDPTRTADGFAKYCTVPAEIGGLVRRHATFYGKVEPEIVEPVVWTLEYHIPFRVLETYVGALGDVRGTEWRANFHKCAENNSHPHWATWTAVGERLDFHQPDGFGVIRFE